MNSKSPIRCLVDFVPAKPDIRMTGIAGERISDRMCEVNPIHVSRHLYVGDDHAYSPIELLDELECLDRIFGFVRLVVPFLEDRLQVRSDDWLIINSD